MQQKSISRMSTDMNSSVLKLTDKRIGFVCAITGIVYLCWRFVCLHMAVHATPSLYLLCLSEKRKPPQSKPPQSFGFTLGPARLSREHARVSGVARHFGVGDIANRFVFALLVSFCFVRFMCGALVSPTPSRLHFLPYFYSPKPSPPPTPPLLALH